MNNLEVVLTSVLAAMGGAALVVAGLAAWLGSIWKDRIDRHESMLTQIDVDLRSRRIDAYTPLWSKMKVLPKWPRDDTVSYERLRQFCEDLRTWYFDTGGLSFPTVRVKNMDRCRTNCSACWKADTRKIGHETTG